MKENEVKSHYRVLVSFTVEAETEDEAQALINARLDNWLDVDGPVVTADIKQG